MMYAYMKFHYSRSCQLLETELNPVDRRKSVYGQQSVLSRPRTDLNQQTTLVLLRLCHGLRLCYVKFHHNRSCHL